MINLHKNPDTHGVDLIISPDIYAYFYMYTSCIKIKFAIIIITFVDSWERFWVMRFNTIVMIDTWIL